MNKHKLKSFFNKKDLFHINWNEIAIDIFLILWIEFFLYSVLTREKLLYQSLSATQLSVLSIIITFVLSWYLWSISFRFEKRIKNTFITTVIFLLAIAIPCLMCVLMYLSIKGIIGQEPSKQVFVWTFFGTFLGIAGGFGFGYSEKEADEGNSVLHSRIVGLLFFTIFATFYLTFFLSANINPFLIYLVGGLVSFTLYRIHKHLDTDTKRKVSNTYLNFRKFVFPVIVIVIVSQWEEIYLWGKIHGALLENKRISFDTMFRFLLFSGIIPVRVLMALQPPVTITGLSSGILSIGYFLYSVNALLKSIFP